jgi:hypothetical protein
MSQPDNLPPEEDDGLMSQEEFAEWVRVPANRESFNNYLMTSPLLNAPDAPPEIAEPLKTLRQKLALTRALKTTQEKLLALRAVAERPAGSMLAKDRLAQCQTLILEITDAILEMPEPHRTRFMEMLRPAREQVLAMRVGE